MGGASVCLVVAIHEYDEVLIPKLIERATGVDRRRSSGSSLVLRWNGAADGDSSSQLLADGRLPDGCARCWSRDDTSSLSNRISSRATIGAAFWFCPVTRLPSTTQ